MHDYKKALAKAVKDARTKQGLSKERLFLIIQGIVENRFTLPYRF